jgi:hypothetical protein
MGHGQDKALHVIAVLAALLAGSAVPLGAPLQRGGQSYGWHVFGEVEGGVLFASTTSWIIAGLLIASDRIGGSWSPPIREAVGHPLICAAISLLALPGLAIAASSLAEQGSASLGIASIIAAQQRWHGLGWIGITQPLALLSWIGCTLTLCPVGQSQVSLAWQLVTLNWWLLIASTFLGGWQGPFADQAAWLGYAYTAVKVGLLSVSYAWASARLPIAHPLRQVRTAWTVYMPLLLVNLVLTAALATSR